METEFQGREGAADLAHVTPSDESKIPSAFEVAINTFLLDPTAFQEIKAEIGTRRHKSKNNLIFY
jgi:hypothetical protein